MTEETVSREVAASANELRLSMMRLVRRLRAERPTHGLSLTRINALGRLDREGPATVTELAAAEGITPQSMARAVTELVDSGLVTRQADPHDGRQVLLALAPDGARLLAEDRARRDTWLAVRMAERLSPEERDLLRVAGRLFDRIAGA
jgi:DNA-binding MarR family transcriptional regulator